MAKKAVKKEKKEVSWYDKLKGYDKQLFYILIIMTVVVVVFMIIYYYFIRVPTTFEYNGLKFYIENWDSFKVYKYSYYFRGKDSWKLFDLRLRIDPRENNVSVSGDKILFPRGKFIYLSVNETGLNKCGAIAPASIGSLTTFIVNNDLTLKSASPDINISEEKGIKFANCTNYPDNAVILVQESNRTEIVSDELCYKIYVYNCEILPAFERFMLQTIIESNPQKVTN